MISLSKTVTVPSSPYIIYLIPVFGEKLLYQTLAISAIEIAVTLITCINIAIIRIIITFNKPNLLQSGNIFIPLAVFRYLLLTCT